MLLQQSLAQEGKEAKGAMPPGGPFGGPWGLACAARVRRDAAAISYFMVKIVACA